MGNLPAFVEFREEGPREGFQMEKRLFSLKARAKVIDALSETGLKQIQVASFVSPKAVPSMADAEELFKAITPQEGIRYTGVWLNKRGFERIVELPEASLNAKIVLYTTDDFCLMNNNCTAGEMQHKELDFLNIYDSYGLPLEDAYILTAFGCNLSGDVPLSTVIDYVKFITGVCRSQSRPLPNIYLADTVGWANPEEVKRRIEAVRDTAPGARLGLHLHDTRGLGAANFYAALQVGVDLFDSSVAGLGGCPFAGHKNINAAGNICTEDMVFMCHELGIETGIDLEKLIAAARLTEEIIGRTLPGKIMHSGPLSTFRKHC